MKIYSLILIGKYILIVYHSAAKCYQFSVIDSEGMVLDFPEIFYTSAAAEREGREAIRANADY